MKRQLRGFAGSLERADLGLLVSVAVLLLLGIFVVYGAGSYNRQALNSPLGQHYIIAKHLFMIGIGCVLICRAGKLKGIFTERDVLAEVVGRGIDPAKTPVRKLMTENPEYLRPTDSIAYALNKMSVGGYRHVPLVDNARVPVGVISVKDLIGYIVHFFPKSIMNLPTLPRQNYAREREGA